MKHLAASAETAAVSILADLVALRSFDCEFNLDLVAYLKNRFAAVQATTTRIPFDDGTRSSLIATIEPMREGGIMLSGHTDVVPVGGQNWTSDPFMLREHGGRLYGRGTCDMKGFLAACMSLLPEMAALALSRPIHFAFSYDEELGCPAHRA